MASADNESMKKQVISNLRACLISAQGGVALSFLNNDYRQILGENIPYKVLGYSSLDKFISSIPDFVVKSKNGEYHVEAKATQNSEHISKLVERQKKSSSKNKRRGSGNSRRPPAFYSRNMNKAPRLARMPTPSYPQFQSTNKPYQFKQDTMMGSRYLGPPMAYVPRAAAPTPPRVVTPAPCPPATKNNVEPKPPVAQPPPLMASLKSPPTISRKLPDIVQTSPNPRLNLSSNIAPSSNAQTCEPAPLFNDLVSNPAQKRLSNVTSLNNNVEVKTAKLGGSKLKSLKRRVPFEKGSYVEKLVIWANSVGWPEPEFTMLPRKPKGSKCVYTCRVTVHVPNSSSIFLSGYNDYSTFPDEFINADEAKEMVARKAYIDLLIKESKSSGARTINDDPEAIIKYVSQAVNGRPQGVWAFQLEKSFLDEKYAKLPPDWISIVKNSDVLRVEKLGDNSYIIRPKTMNSESWNSTRPDVTSETWHPPQIILPEHKIWEVFVTRVVSASEIWIGLVGDKYYDLLDTLTKDIVMHYKEHCNKFIPDYLDTSKSYVYFNIEDNIAYRVFVSEVNLNSKTATVTLIDTGEEDVVDISMLYVLDERFATAPTRALKCKLHGLDRYPNRSAVEQLLHYYTEKKYMLCEMVNAKKCTIILYDVSGNVPVNINETMYEEIDYLCHSPKLEIGTLREAYVTFIELNETVSLQLPSKAMMFISEQLSNVNREQITPLTYIQSIDYEKLYMLYEDGQYYRVEILPPSDASAEVFKVRLVDIGRISSVNLSDLFDFENFSGILGSIPPQSVSVALKDVPIETFNTDKAKKLHEIVPEDESILIKTHSFENGIPVVEMFKRLKPSNIIISINNTIYINTDMFPNQSDSLALQKDTTNLQNDFVRLSCDELNKAILPQIDEEYFDIYIVESASPFNFTVQPLKYVKQFKNLMDDMQEYYNSPEVETKSLKRIQPGVLCVALERRNIWCRATIHKVINSEEISIRYSDYGNIDVVSLSNIKPLMPEFSHLPGIGFCAKLYGIVPLHGDWGPEDCVRVQELLDGKILVSIIKEYVPNPQVPGDMILGLQVIDTNTEQDIDLCHMLVLEGRAKYA